MWKRRLAVIVMSFLIITTFSTCTKYYASDSSEDTDEQTNQSTGSENSEDYVWSSSDVIEIMLNETSIVASSTAVTIAGSVATITSPGTYSLTGSLTDGQIIVNVVDDGIVRLILNGAAIKCSGSAPVVVKSAEKVLLVLTDNTANSITDGSSYSVDSDGEPNAAIFSKSYLSFYGNGSLTVEANYNDGITSKDGLVIKSGKINVTAADDGIRGKDYLIIHNGDITVISKGDGLKSDNEDDTGKGYISIDSAIVNITASAGDAMDAQTDITISDGSFTVKTGLGAGSSASIVTTTTDDKGMTPPGGGGTTTGGYNGTISEKAFKAKGTLTIKKGTFSVNAADDALHSNEIVVIEGGTFAIASGDDGIHAETSITLSNATIFISTCYEGIESKTITVNSGEVNVVSTDDGFNATAGKAVENNDGSYLYFKGGNVFVSASTGDGLDSNGSIEISGGTVVVQGPKSSPEVAYDYNGTFVITGGALISSGPNSGNMIQTPSTSSTQYIVKAMAQSSLAASTLFHVQDADGNDIFTFKSSRSVYYIVFSSPALTNGTNYSIYTGGSSTGTYISGLYTGGTYSGGTLKKSFYLSGKVTGISF